MALGKTSVGKKEFSPTSLRFKTGKMVGRDMKTVRIVFHNEGHANVILDDVRVFMSGIQTILCKLNYKP